jgi:hypothetical protein
MIISAQYIRIYGDCQPPSLDQGENHPDCDKWKQQLSSANSMGVRALGRLAANGGGTTLLDVLSTVESMNAATGSAGALRAYSHELRIAMNNTTISTQFGKMSVLTNVRPHQLVKYDVAGKGLGLLGLGIDSYQTMSSAIDGDVSGVISNGASAGLNGTILLIASSNPLMAFSAGAGALFIGVAEQGAYGYLNARDARWLDQQAKRDELLFDTAIEKTDALEQKIADNCPD